MASPPRYSQANSPPFPSPASLPKPRKRPSLHLSGNPSALKRRKQTAGSIASATSSAHPLRQTSFPPEEVEAAANESALRSPSVDSDFTGVTGRQSTTNASGTGKPGPKKRGRKSKKGRQPSGSVKSGTGGGAKAGGLQDGEATPGPGGPGAAGRRRAQATESRHEDEEDEDEDDGLDDADLQPQANDDMVSAEHENLAVLVKAFNDDQSDRYEMYRRVKLKKEVLRRITNHVVSQSLPAGVITTINGYTKLFIGSLIEKAREVQEQWESLQTPPAETGQHGVGEEGDEAPSKKQKTGPLKPEHLREALRRYKIDGEAGGTGLNGVSVGLGQQGTGSARLKGKPLFS